MDFFIIENDEQRGPFTLEQLNGMLIFADTPVWHEGLSDWTKASEIAELKDIVITLVEPEKNNPIPPKWNGDEAQMQYASPKKPKRSHKGLFWTLGVAAALAIILAVSNPNEEDHCREITSVSRSWVNETIDDFDMNNFIGGTIKFFSTKIIRNIVDDNVRVDNYGLFSIGYIDDGAEKTRVSFGILGNVFTFNKEQLNEKIKSIISENFMSFGDFFSFDGNIGNAVLDRITNIFEDDLIDSDDNNQDALPPSEDEVDDQESDISSFMPSVGESLLKEGAKMAIKEGADFLIDKIDGN